jgi:hypothetical protein
MDVYTVFERLLPDATTGATIQARPSGCTLQVGVDHPESTPLVTNSMLNMRSAGVTRWCKGWWPLPSALLPCSMPR